MSISQIEEHLSKISLLKRNQVDDVNMFKPSSNLNLNHREKNIGQAILDEHLAFCIFQKIQKKLTRNDKKKKKT